MAPKSKQRKGMGHLYKRDSSGKEVPANSKKAGTYWLAYRDTTGKRVKVRLEINGVPVTDYATAQKEQLRLRAPYLTGSRLEILKAVEADIRRLETQRERETEEANPPLKIADAWAAYENASNRPECGPETIQYYKITWRRLVEWVEDTYKDTPLVYMRDVTDSVANAHMAAMRQLPWSANTYNKHLAFLKLIFRVLAKPARMKENPFADITRRKLTTNSRRALTIEELRRVITTATGNLRALFEIGTFTGLRLGDCATLRWCDVDLQRGIIRRKPNKTLRSSGAEVTIGIPGVLYGTLAQCSQDTEYVLPDIAEMYMDKNKRTYLSKMIQRHFKACGIKIHADGTGHKSHYEGKKKVYEDTARAIVLVGFHSLRHTYASLHAASGTPPALIQENMGHSNPAMTEHYTHIDAETARNAAAALDLPQLVADDEQLAASGKEEKIKQQLIGIIQNADGALLNKLLRVITGGLLLPPPADDL